MPSTWGSLKFYRNITAPPISHYSLNTGETEVAALIWKVRRKNTSSASRTLCFLFCHCPALEIPKPQLLLLLLLLRTSPFPADRPLGLHKFQNVFTPWLRRSFLPEGTCGTRFRKCPKSIKLLQPQLPQWVLASATLYPHLSLISPLGPHIPSLWTTRALVTHVSTTTPSSRQGPSTLCRDSSRFLPRRPARLLSGGPSCKH